MIGPAPIIMIEAISSRRGILVLHHGGEPIEEITGIMGPG